MTTAQDQQSRAAELRATIDMLDECAKAGKPWPYVPSTESIRAVLDELSAAQVQAMGRVPTGWQAVPVEPDAQQLRTVYKRTGVARQELRELWAEFLKESPRPPAAQDVPSGVRDAIGAAGMQLLKGADGFKLEKAATASASGVGSEGIPSNKPSGSRGLLRPGSKA